MLKYVQVHRIKEPMTLSTLSFIVFKFKLSKSFACHESRRPVWLTYSLSPLATSKSMKYNDNTMKFLAYLFLFPTLYYAPNTHVTSMSGAFHVQTSVQ